jgi:hypothetical protein
MPTSPVEDWMGTTAAADELAPAALLPGDGLHEVPEEVVETVAERLPVEGSLGGEGEETVDNLPVRGELARGRHPAIQPFRELPPLIGLIRVRRAGMEPGREPGTGRHRLPPDPPRERPTLFSNL